MSTLEELPARMDRFESQLLELREEMRGEFSALRGELSEVRGELRTEISGVRGELRTEISGLRGELRGEIAALQTVLQAEIRAGDEETRRYMRVLHEDVIARFALLQEGRQTPARRKAAGDKRREPKR